MPWKRILFIAIIAYGAFNAWHNRPVTHGVGQVAKQAPIQQGLPEQDYQSALNSVNSVLQDPMQGDADASQTQHINGYQIIPLASFSIQARVLSREDYSFGREADLSPIDLALGWGPMSDEAVLSKVSISQSNRFYFWHVDEFPIPRDDIETHSANMHMIPENDHVKEILESVRVGQVVNIEGYLVEAKASDGWHWKSSLTRQDTGNGACEVILVKRISVQ